MKLFHRKPGEPVVNVSRPHLTGLSRRRLPASLAINRPGTGGGVVFTDTIVFPGMSAAKETKAK